ncbi:DUF4136 domain-containing protein [Sphingomonas sp. GCM10030256]|uniref:DUF4136 domain-containing protein n=1 Tax=Sphingomonas sp. GCM10030256 TaxID=3273427 RepID=UPI00360960E0
MNMLRKAAAAVLAGAALLGLSGCATGLPAKVTRFQAMPAPQGQTFYVVPGQGEAQRGGLEFQRYANMVTNALVARGYQPAASPQAATMIVQLGYDVDEGREVVVVDNSFGGNSLYGSRYYDPFYRSYYGGRFGAYDPYWGIYRGRPYYSRWGYYGPRSAFYYGWDDPFWYGDRGLRQYTEYRSELDLDIRSRADNRSLFEGTARARSRTENLGVLVPNLIEAMFTGFPGRSGETVKITVPTSTSR